MRADSGFWSWKLVDALNRLDVLWSITVSQHAAIRAAIATIPEIAWVDIDYTLGGKAQVAETDYTTGTGRRARTVRLVVRRTRLTGRQAQLFPDWRHHAFITNTALDAVAADAFHRNHAIVELAIRDLKEGAGLEHCPSGHYSANAAWLTCAVLAHNLIPLDQSPRRREPRPCRVEPRHDPHPPHRHRRHTREPIWATHPAAPTQLAMGKPVHPDTQRPPGVAGLVRLTTNPAAGAPPNHPQR